MNWENRGSHFFILFLLAFIWGSSFILMKIGLKSFSSEQAAGIRIFLASLVLLPYSIKNLKHLKKKDIKSLLVAGFIGSFFPAFLFMKAQTRIDSSLAGMLNSMTPVFTMLIGVIIHKTRFKWWQLIGLAVGLLGAVGLITSGDFSSLKNINSYSLFIVLATVFYATSINDIRANLRHLSGVEITSLSFLFIGPVSLIYLLTTDFTPVIQNPDWLTHFAALAILGILGTAIAMLLMNSLIRWSATAVFASSVTYIIPVFAIFWGFMDGEVITFMHICCMSLILLGVYLINRKK